MTPPKRGLLDTSVFIAGEVARQIDESLLPEQAAIAVITLAELHVGVLAAKDTKTRAQRLATLESTADIVALPVDERVAAVWAQLRVALAEAGLRANVNDLWIAAIAVGNDLAIVTQDADFESIKMVADVLVIRV